MPELFEELKERDALYLIRIGNHLFVALHYYEEKILLISDGLNSASFFMTQSGTRNVCTHWVIADTGVSF